MTVETQARSVPAPHILDRKRLMRIADVLAIGLAVSATLLFLRWRRLSGRLVA